MLQSFWFNYKNSNSEFESRNVFEDLQVAHGVGFQQELGNVTGNPQVSQPYPYPYLWTWVWVSYGSICGFPI